MSVVTCRQCGGSNPPGSKFCNLCGSMLPPATSIFCPECHQPNALSLMYCDQCGARLQREEQADSEKPKAADGGGTRAFDLPMRKDDGEQELELPALNDSAAVSDWLRREGLAGQASAADEPDHSPRETDDADQIAPHASSDSVPEGEPPFADFARWLEALEGMPVAELPEEQPSGEVAESSVPDWLQEVQTAHADDESATEGRPDALQEALLAPELAGVDSATDVTALAGPATMPDDEPVDWLEAISLDDEISAAHQGSPSQPAEADASPDWLSDLADEEESLAPFAAAAEAIEQRATGDTDWLAALSEASDAADTVEPWSAEAPPPVVDGDAFVDVGAMDDGEMPEWLAALTGDDGQLTVSDHEGDPDEALTAASEAAEEVGWLIESGTLVDEPSELLVEEISDAVPAAEEQSVQSPPDIPETADDELDELPSSLDVTDDDAEEAAPDATPDEALPAWLQEMESLSAEAGLEGRDVPGAGNDLPGAFDSGQMGLLSDVPAELAGAELPSWLLDSLGQPRSDESSGATLPGVLDEADASARLREPESQVDLPDWLQPEDADEFDAALQAAMAARQRQRGGEARGSEWSGMLGEGPGAQADDLDLPAASEFARLGGAQEPQLAAADIPEWLQPFKPRELRQEGEEQLPEQPAEEGGALAGLRGVIGIEPVVAQPRSGAGSGFPFAVSPAQQEQALLLEQLAVGLEAPSRAPGTPSTRPLPGVARLLIVVLLILAIAAGLFAPDLVADLTGASSGPIPAEALAAFEAVEASAGMPVIVAVEYTPALAGELGPQTTMLLAQLAENGNSVMVVSQSAAGATLAEQAADAIQGLQWSSLGYLPGDVAGLRALGSCLAEGAACSSAAGKPVDISRFGGTPILILLISGDRGQVVGWIEQVSTPARLPLVAATTTSLVPSLAPYYISDQVSGYIGGQAAAAGYERLWSAEPGAISERELASAPARWLVIVMLLVGNLVALVRGRRDSLAPVGPVATDSEADGSIVETDTVESWKNE